MTRMRKKRGRQAHPDVLAEIRDMLATGASAGSIHDALISRQDNDPSYLPHLDIPKTRTITNIAADFRRDDSEAWTLEDSNPTEAQLVLRVLLAAARRSRGRIRHLTRREAHLSAVFLALTPGVEGGDRNEHAWHAFVRARTYLAAVNRAEDLSAVHLDLQTFAELDEALELQPGMIDPVGKEIPVD